MNNKQLLSIALIVLFLGGLIGYALHGTPNKEFSAGIACDQITCLSGGLRLVTGAGGDFEVDVASVFGGSVKVGTSGTAQVNQVTTTCAMQANLSIAATSTGYAFCTGVTGVTSADNIVAQFASSTGALNLNTDNWVISSSKASTTAGAIDFVLLNLTGLARTPSASSRIGSTTSIFASH